MIKRKGASVVFQPTPPPPPVPPTKQQYLCQPLLDAVLANIRSPVFNHSLYRTFMPAMTAIHGQPITYVPQACCLSSVLIIWGKMILYKLLKEQMGFWMGMTYSFSFFTCKIFNKYSVGTFSPGPFVDCVLHRAPIASPRKRKYEEDERQTIPNVLQGEVARLNPKFLVNLDPSHCSNNGTVHLICKLGKKKGGNVQSGSSLGFRG